MKLKKILSAFLAAALIVTYVPWYAFQASAANLDFENQVADFGTIITGRNILATLPSMQVLCGQTNLFLQTKLWRQPMRHTQASM